MDSLVFSLLHLILFCFALLALLAWFTWFGCLICFGLLCLLTFLDLLAFLVCLALSRLLAFPVYDMRGLTWLVLLVLAWLELARLGLAW